MTRKPPRPDNGEGCYPSGSERRMHRRVPPGYWRQHAWKRRVSAAREALTGGVARANRRPVRVGACTGLDPVSGRQGRGEAHST